MYMINKNAGEYVSKKPFSFTGQVDIYRLKRRGASILFLIEF